MLRLYHVKKAAAVVTMAVASLCGGGKAVAEQKGTLSVVEVRGNATLRPDTLKRLTGLLRSRLVAKGHDDAIVLQSENETFAVWTGSQINNDLNDLPTDGKGISFSALDDTATQADLAAGTVASGHTIRASKDPREERLYAVRDEAILTAADVVDAFIALGYSSESPVVQFSFNEAGAAIFGEWTRRSIGKALAIVVDGEVLSAPIIREPILGGSGQISGYFSVDEAEALVWRLSFPAGVQQVVVLSTCAASRPRGPPAWAPKWFSAAPACDE